MRRWSAPAARRALRDKESAERTLGGCFAVQIILSIILTAALLIWGGNLLMAFGCSENTIGYATDYMRIYALGTLFVQLTLGMNAFITAQGFARQGMITVLIGALINIALDPLLIFTFDMGVRGAALATIISQGVSCAWVVAFLRGKTTYLRLRRRYIRPDMRIVLPCMALGAATFIMQSSESVLSVCFNSSLVRYGGDIAVGAMTILSSTMQFALLPMQGIAQGSQPISSYNFGAGNMDRVKKTFRLLLITCFGYSIAVWAFVMLLPAVFAGIFSDNAELIAFTARALRVYCAALGLFGIQIACQMTFVSIGSAVCSIIVAVVRKFVLLIPLIYIMPHILPDPVMGVYHPVQADSVCIQQLPRCKRRIHGPIDLRDMDSLFLFASNLFRIHVLMPIDSRHQNLRSFSPSAGCAGTFLVRGRLIPWLHLMGELSKPSASTEGEKPTGAALESNGFDRRQSALEADRQTSGLPL